MQIRPFEEFDWPQVWPIFRDIVRVRETYTYDPDLTAEQAHDTWIEAPPGLTVVAGDGERVLGTAKMGPNRQGPGAHVSTASFMVAGDAQGRGVGTALCAFALGYLCASGAWPGGPTHHVLRVLSLAR